LARAAAILGANVAGGLIFGVGMVLLGLCPGTAVAALGEGNRRALAGLLGMFVGAWIQAETYGLLAGLARSVDLGPLTWPELLAMSPWGILAALALASLAVFVGLEAWERRRMSAGTPQVATPAEAATFADAGKVFVSAGAPAEQHPATAAARETPEQGPTSRT
jgi:uncharacterized membrane protein YedE/YeeE